ncbi:MAG: aminoglycoside phosphotransferase family protein [Chloroflexota bacterium]|nr:aminoglycoside phosphotransferase family protein [Chloroflexota bacterium]MDQ3689977.1 aminoglycoside phosphotransferase family protein [Chloroflexota bacterium]
MLEDPGLDPLELAGALRVAYGIDASALSFVPGYDLQAASYEVTTPDGSYFLKVRFDAVQEAALDVPRALLEAGVPNILAPIPTRSSALWAGMDGRSVVLQPFLRGRNAMVAGLTDDQWHTFGATLRAVHDSGLERSFADRLPVETFALAAAVPVRRILEAASRQTFESPTARQLAAFCRQQAGRISATLERAEELGARLRVRSFDLVLCHADIHAANILVTDEGGIVLVDWDGPMIAPRERDLLFVIGSRIARLVEPHEEARFFEGYGGVEVDPEAVVYYRYERILEDIWVDAASVFGDDSQSEATRQAQVDQIVSFFVPGGDLETAEQRGAGLGSVS